MSSFSRRQLAHYAVERLLDGESPATLSKHLSAALTAAKKQKEADLLLNDIAHELESRGLLARATVTSASRLSPTLRKQLINKIEKAAKVREVVLTENIDEDVIGGIKVETANHSWDNTLVRRLADIKGGI